MDILYEFQDSLLAQTTDDFFRYLIDEINWNQRMLAIKGPRGTGKTTMILQYIKYRLQKPREQVLYITADHYWFYTHNLVETADTFYKNGGRYLFIDEVHKYPHWSRELKNIYDGYPQLRIVFSSSSALDIYRGEADLSRRVITYELPGLSFREFLVLQGFPHMQAYKWADILKKHVAISGHIKEQLQPLPWFKKYLQWGNLPLFVESTHAAIPLRLSQTINTIIETDLSYAESYTVATAFKIKKLLGVLAESAPFKPNVAALSRKMDVGREYIYAWLQHLQRARLLNLLHADNKGVSALQKPDKIYLENPNLAFALKAVPETGNIRETFLLNQLINMKYTVSLPDSGDFRVHDTIVEVGGKSKTAAQVKHKGKYIIAADEIETGIGSKIPLWLFGMMY